MSPGAPEIALTHDARLGENPVWDERSQTLLWLDIQHGEVHRFDPATGTDQVTARLPGEVGAAVLTDGQDLLVGLDDRLVRLTEASGAVVDLTTVPAHGVRFNDARCDAVGRLLIGTLARDGGTQAGLYALREGRLEQVVGDLTISNGVDVDPERGRLYLADTVGERVLVLDYDEGTGSVGPAHVLLDLEGVPGRPDGLAVDAEGNLWVAMARARQVRAFRPNGSERLVLDVPAHAVTSLTFGGPELADLYITTGSFAADEADLARWPGTGSLWRVTGIGTGRPARRYTGR